MKKIICNIFYFVFRPPSYLILTAFTAGFFYLIWREITGAGQYPAAYTFVYITVIICTSLSNLLKKSRWFGMG